MIDLFSWLGCLNSAGEVKEWRSLRVVSEIMVGFSMCM